jgi:precorrin-2 dehydrogenase/sirohydrochlorin ferrochelatase
LEDVIPTDIQETMDGLEAYRNSLKGDFEAKIKALNELTRGLTFKK